MAGVVRVLGLDPGLQRTGWGVIEAEGNKLRHIANGCVSSRAGDDLGRRLLQLHDGLNAVLAAYSPDTAAVEETFVNKNPHSTLKLGQARGVVMLAPAIAGLPIREYAPNKIKKSVVGTGHAGKDQIRAMIDVLLPGTKPENADAADALAVAICHAHHMTAVRPDAAARV